MNRIPPTLMRAAALLTLALTTQCHPSGTGADAYGTFEATEVTLSAETAGRLVRLEVSEGQVVKAGDRIAVIDTVQQQLRRAQLLAQRRGVQARLGQLGAQLAVADEQLSTARRELARAEQLYADGAATAKQRDDARSASALAERQRQTVVTQQPTLSAELAAIDALLAQTADQIARSTLRAPQGGTILSTLSEVGEVVAPGRAVATLAQLQALDLRCYVSATQLPQLKIGQSVQVAIDATATTDTLLPGTVTWVASQAEFTPKVVQTKEERVTLVYAVKVRVKNDGRLKIGMPGELRLSLPSAN